jgi:hypothetical protein
LPGFAVGAIITGGTALSIVLVFIGSVII